MAYWLFKSEPGTWSWDDQVKAGPKGDEWDGVRNHAAKLNMQKMKPGDRGFFYHSVDEKRIVGIVKVVSEPHPDSTDKTGTWFCVDIAAESPLPRPVTLAEIKEEPRLAGMALVKQSRLSVQPVTDQEWEIICKMAAVKKATKSATTKTATKTAAKAPAKSASKSTTSKTTTTAKSPSKTASKSTTSTKTAAAKTTSKTAASKSATASKTSTAKTASTKTGTASKSTSKTSSAPKTAAKTASKTSSKTSSAPKTAAKSTAKKTTAKK